MCALALSVFSAGALAFNDCQLQEYDILEDEDFLDDYYSENGYWFNGSYQLSGYVSTKGHYSEDLQGGVIDYPYGLFCDSMLVLNRTDGHPTFHYSDPLEIVATEIIDGDEYDVRGSGLVSFESDTLEFEAGAYHGFTEGDCELRPIGEGCDESDVCVVRMSHHNSDDMDAGEQGVVADCNDDSKPYDNEFEHVICCTPREYCRDGIDNTGDGLIDCASPDCHATTVDEVPQRCDPDPDYDPGNNQSTPECVVGGSPGDPEFSEHCTYSTAVEDDYFYCSYGELDDPEEAPGGEGYCCPEGQYYDPDQGMCEDFTKCGIGAGYWCDYDVNDYFDNWLDEVFDDPPSGLPKWCHSHLPLFREDADRSEACCPIVHMGTNDYYVVDENVKTFGYEE